MDQSFSRTSSYTFPEPFMASKIRVTTATPSLINYVPSSIGGGFQSKFEDSTTDLVRAKSLPVVYDAEEHNLEDPDQRCEELWREFRDEVGPWMSHRFTLHEWDFPRKNKSTATETSDVVPVEELDTFDGRLTKKMIASGLSNLDRCPEFYHYSYIKCVLNNKRLLDIDALKSYHYLQYVDVSGNKLRTLQPLGNLPFLKYLDASRNLLTSVLDFKPAPHFLTSVNLAYNRFQVIRDLSEFWSITDLNLAHNGIRAIEGLQKLSYLTTLNLSYNRIDTIENLSDMRIQFLHLQNNHIMCLEDDEKAKLHTLNNIRTINLSHNQVSSLKIFESVENLECLEIPYNEIFQLLDIYYLRNLKYLNKLNLVGNAVTNLRRYVEVCITNIRNLVYLDGEHINYDFWLQKLSDRATDVGQIAAHQRLKLLMLEQLNKPGMWDWLLPYDTSPLAIIVLVGLQASRRGHIAKKFCTENENAVLGIPYTTRTKHGDEVEGEFHYYIEQEEFRTMLKEGKFFTYQEHLGFYYGIAHSEFKKAEDGILIFYTDLTMALSIKSRFLNTKLILTLPSTRKVHLDNLSKLYAIRLVDSGTIRIINSPAAVKHCQKEFIETKNRIIGQEVQCIVEDLVDMVSRVSTHDHRTSQDYMVSNMNMEPDSSIWQIWSAPDRSHSSARMSRRIPPMDPFSFDVGSNTAEFSHPKNQSQMQKYVSFIGTNVRRNKGEENCSLDDDERNGCGDDEDLEEKTPEEARDAPKYPVGVKTHPSEPSWLNEVTEDETCRLRTPTKSSQLFMRHETYSDIICDDERIQAIFTGELNQREELLEMHWSTPGLFRELLFSDHEEETLQKLRQLVRDVSKFSETDCKPMFDFDNDENVNALAKERVAKCFTNMARELSLSDKQAAEFLTDVEPHICGSSACQDPTCPRF